MTNADDARFMGLALSLGARGLGQVWPWPSVGCVLVKDGRLVGRGCSDAETVRHAERVALDHAGDAARGATAYVTLEPCSHTGRTSPCATALVAAGIARVVVATGDPNPLVAGQGLSILRNAGITTTVGVGEAEALETHKGFFLRIAEGRPMVTLKLATSFDGRIATASGESQWITGRGARALAHSLRHSHDAVLVGGGTARADDPSLTVRGFGKVRQPVRIVAARQLDLPASGNLADPDGKGALWLVHGDKDVPEARAEFWRDLGADLVTCAVGAGSRLDMPAMLSALGDSGLTRVLCEGGGSIGAALLQADCVDEIVCFTAGVTLGAEGRPAIGAMGIEELGAAPRFELVESRPVDGDVFHRWARRA